MNLLGFALMGRLPKLFQLQLYYAISKCLRWQRLTTILELLLTVIVIVSALVTLLSLVELPNLTVLDLSRNNMGIKLTSAISAAYLLYLFSKTWISLKLTLGIAVWQESQKVSCTFPLSLLWIYLPTDCCFFSSFTISCTGNTFLGRASD